MISNRYEFDIDKLITELQVIKIDRLKTVRQKNKGKFSTIKDLKYMYYVEIDDINKILENIKEYKKGEIDVTVY